MTGLSSSILAIVAELRRPDGPGALEQLPDAIGPGKPGWAVPGSEPAKGLVGFGDNLMKQAWSRKLLRLDHEEGAETGPNGRKRVALRPAAEIDAILRQLDAEHRAEMATLEPG